MSDTRKTFRVNKDNWTDLVDILVGKPIEFNPDLKKGYDRRSGMDKFTGTLRGRYTPDKTQFPLASIEIGQLPEEYAADFENAIAVGVMEFVIYSYKTPIAWREYIPVNERVTKDGATHAFKWVVPDVKYSNTTSKHQSKVRTALSQISGGI